jgi:hypothetical protein
MENDTQLRFYCALALEEDPLRFSQIVTWFQGHYRKNELKIAPIIQCLGKKNIQMGKGKKKRHFRLCYINAQLVEIDAQIEKIARKPLEIVIDLQF